jgi:hypothetical protein
MRTAARELRLAIAPLAIIVATSVAARPTATGIAPAPAAAEAYEIELTYTGYTGEIEGAPNCRVNPRGYDKMVGTVSDSGAAEAGEDVVYTGVLTRTTAIDFCQSKGKRSPDDDERVWCTETLTGTATMVVELTVYAEAGRGAYVKAEAGKRPGTVSVTGDCEAATAAEIRNAYPRGDDGGGASPNGQPIDDGKAVDANGRRIGFVAGGVARLRPGRYPPDSPKGGWTLRVIRELPR